MAGEKRREASIIEIIEEMVRQGEPEEKIISTLKDLGVREEQAKKLLLLGEADTFALLKSEIRKIVKEDLQREEQMLIDVIKRLISVQEEKAEEKMRKGIEQLKKGLMERVEEEEMKEAKKEKLNEIIRRLEEPQTTHGVKLDGVISGRKDKKKKREGVEEIRF